MQFNIGDRVDIFNDAVVGRLLHRCKMKGLNVAAPYNTFIVTSLPVQLASGYIYKLTDIHGLEWNISSENIIPHHLMDNLNTI